MESSEGKEEDEEVHYENNRQLLADLDEEDAEDMDIPMESIIDDALIFDNYNDTTLENVSEAPQPSVQRNETARQRFGRVTWRRTNLKLDLQNIHNFPQDIQYPDSI